MEVGSKHTSQNSSFMHSAISNVDAQIFMSILFFAFSQHSIATGGCKAENSIKWNAQQQQW